MPNNHTVIASVFNLNDVHEIFNVWDNVPASDAETIEALLGCGVEPHVPTGPGPYDGYGFSIRSLDVYWPRVGATLSDLEVVLRYHCSAEAAMLLFDHGCDRVESREDWYIFALYTVAKRIDLLSEKSEGSEQAMLAFYHFGEFLFDQLNDFVSDPVLRPNCRYILKDNLGLADLDWRRLIVICYETYTRENFDILRKTCGLNASKVLMPVRRIDRDPAPQAAPHPPSPLTDEEEDKGSSTDSSSTSDQSSIESEEFLQGHLLDSEAGFEAVRDRTRRRNAGEKVREDSPWPAPLPSSPMCNEWRMYRESSAVRSARSSITSPVRSH